MPSLTQIFMIPVITRLSKKIGVELTIFTAGLLYSGAFMIFSFSGKVDEKGPFIGMCIAANIVIGFAAASNTVGEQTLLLKYSEKSDREKNLGMFRAAVGLGGLLAPLLGASMFVWGEFMATFMTIGIGYLLISPFIYRQLYRAKDDWDAELKRLKEEEEERSGLLGLSD